MRTRKPASEVLEVPSISQIKSEDPRNGPLLELETLETTRHNIKAPRATRHDGNILGTSRQEGENTEALKRNLDDYCFLLFDISTESDSLDLGLVPP